MENDNNELNNNIEQGGSFSSQNSTGQGKFEIVSDSSIHCFPTYK